MNVCCLITVVRWLERSCDWDTDVVGLLLGELRKLNTKRTQMETSDLLVELLRKDVHLTWGRDTSGAGLVFTVILVIPKFDLGEGLVGE